MRAPHDIFIVFHPTQWYRWWLNAGILLGMLQNEARVKHNRALYAKVCMIRLSMINRKTGGHFLESMTT